MRFEKSSWAKLGSRQAPLATKNRKAPPKKTRTDYLIISSPEQWESKENRRSPPLSLSGPPWGITACKKPPPSIIACNIGNPQVLLHAVTYP